jgi:hypothetical protein
VQLRNSYAGSDVVVVPSLPTRDFLEPWGLVVNEAFHQGVPVIASTAVGAAAGGLVQHERNGLIVPAGDASALAAALRRLHDDPTLRARLGEGAREAVRPYTPAAWAEGIGRALAAVGASRREAGAATSRTEGGAQTSRAEGPTRRTEGGAPTSRAGGGAPMSRREGGC